MKSAPPMDVIELIPRKMIAASLSATLFALVFGLLFPEPFIEFPIRTLREFLWGYVNSIPVYLMYSFPVILLYGTSTSIVSDLLAHKIAGNKGKKRELLVSALFHLLFGLVLLGVSLISAVLFFITDRMVCRIKEYDWVKV